MAGLCTEAPLMVGMNASYTMRFMTKARLLLIPTRAYSAYTILIPDIAPSPFLNSLP